MSTSSLRRSHGPTGSWTFTTAHAAPPAAVPLLSVDVPVVTNAQNAVVAGSTSTFTSRVRLPYGLPAVSVTAFKFQYSTDAGHTWRPASVTRLSKNTFRVIIVNPRAAGLMALRYSATTAHSGAISQKVMAAYALQ